VQAACCIAAARSFWFLIFLPCKNPSQEKKPHPHAPTRTLARIGQKCWYCMLPEQSHSCTLTRSTPRARENSWTRTAAVGWYSPAGEGTGDWTACQASTSFECSEGMCDLWWQSAAGRLLKGGMRDAHTQGHAPPQAVASNTCWPHLPLSPCTTGCSARARQSSVLPVLAGPTTHILSVNSDIQLRAGFAVAAPAVDAAAAPGRGLHV